MQHFHFFARAIMCRAAMNDPQAHNQTPTNIMYLPGAAILRRKGRIKLGILAMQRQIHYDKQPRHQCLMILCAAKRQAADRNKGFDDLLLVKYQPRFGLFQGTGEAAQ